MKLHGYHCKLKFPYGNKSKKTFASQKRRKRRDTNIVVDKLARPDRGAVDEQDVKSVLVRQAGKLDNEYLTKRARQAEVLTTLQTIQSS